MIQQRFARYPLYTNIRSPRLALPALFLHSQEGYLSGQDGVAFVRLRDFFDIFLSWRSRRFGWKKFDVRRENQGLGLLLCFREQLVEPETICVIAFTLFKAQWDFFLINAVPICECDLNFAL